MSRIIKRGKEFPEANVNNEAKIFAQAAHKMFVKNSWQWADLNDNAPPGYPELENVHIPSVGEIENMLIDLYHHHKKDWSRWGMETGRLRVRCSGSSCRFFIVE